MDQTHSDNHAQRFRSDNNSNNTNVFQPDINFSPNITVTPNIVVSPQTASGSSRNTASGFGLGPTTPVSYGTHNLEGDESDPTATQQRAAHVRVAYERAEEIGRQAAAQTKAMTEQVRSQLDQELNQARQANAQAVRQANETKQLRALVEAEQRQVANRSIQLQNDRAVLNADRVALEEREATFIAAQMKAAEELRVAREEITAMRSLLESQIQALAEQRREMEIERRVDRARELKEALNDDELDGITGEEEGPVRVAAPSEDLSAKYLPATKITADRDDYGVAALAARDSRAMRLEGGGVRGSVDPTMHIARRDPFRTDRSLHGTGLTEIALKQHRSVPPGATVRGGQSLVVHSASPFLGPVADVAASKINADGQHLLMAIVAP